MTKIEKPTEGAKIRENKIYTTRDDQQYYRSNKVLMNQDPKKANRESNKSMDFAGAYSKKDAGRFVNRNNNEPYRESLPTYLRLHENGGKLIAIKSF